MDFFEGLVDYKYKNNIGLCNLTDEFFALIVRKMLDDLDCGIVVVTSNSYEASKLYNFLHNYIDCYLFNADDIDISKVIDASLESVVERFSVLSSIVSSKKPVVVTDVLGYIMPLVSRDNYLKNKLSLGVGKEISRDSLVSSLEEFGYSFDTIVTKTGEVGVRGFVLDIFPVMEENPIRIEFFGDEIEKIRYFDVRSQKTFSDVSSIDIFPVNDTCTSAGDSNICSYFSSEPLVVFKDYKQIEIANERILMEGMENPSKKYLDFYGLVPKKVNYYFSFDSDYDRFSLKHLYSYGVRECEQFNGDFGKFNKYLKTSLEDGKTVIIALPVVRSNVNNFVDALDVPIILTDCFNIFSGKVNLVHRNMLHGFCMDSLVVITEYELYNRKNIRRKSPSYRYGNVIKDITKLEIGDFVVHNMYGIGVYNGLKVLKKRGILEDYIEVLYAKGDKLYIPASKIEYLSKYSGKEGYVPKINALSSSSWRKTKDRVKEKVRYEAIRLLRVQANRQLQQGFAFSKDGPLQVMFESYFEYEETADQLTVADEIKSDMEKPIPMDRILCGDVGYGKTEVAFRAMFKAVIDHKQVFYLCPTTLLSRQQYESALDRFKNFPVNIALINRFTSLKEVNRIINGVSDGSIDILFGTHRLLSNDIKPKDLGLLVVDEEQRFGVSHKEKIKEFKNTIDVLTLTATPIPRTLQMAIFGLKSLSLIETPPKNRKSIQTFIVENSDSVVRDVIYRELSRGGQTFVLSNRVNGIEMVSAKIKRLVPDARVCYAHGKMDKYKLEKVMDDFVNGEYDVLVCTTIIETGVDIPNANTLIVLDADCFGLSQLYQIRGRVGRSDRLAYAYLMYNKSKVLTETAIKRLKVLKDYTELGSGFSIASRDLSIRGAGDILGSEQAGFIDSVGIDLYMKMLQDEMNRLKGIEVSDEEGDSSDVSVIDVGNHIKDSYVSSLDLKIEIHKLINSIDSFKRLDEVRLEITDRFGKVDDDMELYMQQQLFENFVKTKDICKVIDNNNYVEILFSENRSNVLNYEDLFKKSISISRDFDFSYRDNKFHIKMFKKSNNKHPVYFFNQLLKEI